MLGWLERPRARGTIIANIVVARTPVLDKFSSFTVTPPPPAASTAAGESVATQPALDRGLQYLDPDARVCGTRP